MIHSTVRWALFCILMSTIAGNAQAQPDRSGQPQRRQFLDGLLKTLIESQLPSRESRDSTQSAQPGRSQATLDRTTTPKIREASRLLTRASDAMAGLVGSLQSDIYRAQGVRALLAQAMKINADAAVLARRLSRAVEVDSLRDDLRQLDQDWRLLEHRLNQTSNLSRQTLGHVQLVKQYEQQLATLFDVPPQVDLVEISRHATQLAGLLRNLLEDIQLEVTDRELANRLILTGRDVYDLCRTFVRTTGDTASYQTLQRDYEAWEQAWRSYNRDLRQVYDRYIQRQAQRIDAASRQLHELLWLTHEIDPDDLIHITRLLQQDTKQLLGRVTLRMLVDSPAAASRLAVSSASDFETACSDFAECLAAGDEEDTLRELYYYLVDEWQRLSASLQGVQSQAARQSLRDIERSLSELQAMLGVRPEVDRQKAVELAASVTNLARHMQDDMRQYFGRPNRYPRDFQTDSLQAAAQFHAATKKLHTGLVDGEKLRQLKTECEAVSTNWQNFTRYLPRFSGAEQQHLNKFRREITPKVVQVQTLLTL